MIELLGVHHISINVADAAEACRFYTDVLGLKEIDRPNFDFPGHWLEMADGRQLHLIQVADWTPPKGQHWAFDVADIDAARSTIQGAGYKVSEPMTIDGVCRQCFFKDPCGNLIELNEPARA